MYQGGVCNTRSSFEDTNYTSSTKTPGRPQHSERLQHSSLLQWSLPPICPYNNTLHTLHTLHTSCTNIISVVDTENVKKEIIVQWSKSRNRWSVWGVRCLQQKFSTVCVYDPYMCVCNLYKQREVCALTTPLNSGMNLFGLRFMWLKSTGRS